MANLDALMTSARTGESHRDEWRTPAWLFNLLDAEFHFTLDPAATKENALCENYFTDHTKDPYSLGDGLISTWSGVAFVNPPYSQLRKWVEKGFREASEGHAQVVMLVPARTDTRAWWDYIRFGDVRFLPGRLKFEGGKYSAPFPSAIVIFEKRVDGLLIKRPTTRYWQIRGPK